MKSVLLALFLFAAPIQAQAGYQGLPASGGGGGSVTGVTGTAPILSSGGTAPVISCITATGSVAGCISAASFTLFTAKESALTFTAPLTRTTNTITCAVATGSVPGCISAADWTTFNAKAAANANTTGTASNISPTVQAKSSAFTAVQGFVYSLSGSNYAIALPDATTTTQPITFVTTSAPVELSGPITFTFTGGQTAGGFSTYGLYTPGEILTLQSNGANFLVTLHQTTMAWSTGLTFVPNSGCFGTISNASYRYRRLAGTDIEVEGEFQAGTTAAAFPQIGFPSTLAIDTTAFPGSSALLVGRAVSKTSAQTQMDTNTMYPYYDGSTSTAVFMAYYTKTADFLSILGNGGSGIINNSKYNFRFIVPVSGWRP